jgi:hypothetical protein
MKFSENVLKIAKAAADKHPADILQAIDEAEKGVWALPEFPALVDRLVRQTVEDLVHRFRNEAETGIQHSFSQKDGESPAEWLGRLEAISATELSRHLQYPLSDCIRTAHQLCVAQAQQAERTQEKPGKGKLKET